MPCVITGHGFLLSLFLLLLVFLLFCVKARQHSDAEAPISNPNMSTIKLSVYTTHMQHIQI